MSSLFCWDFYIMDEDTYHVWSCACMNLSVATVVALMPRVAYWLPWKLHVHSQSHSFWNGPPYNIIASWQMSLKYLFIWFVHTVFRKPSLMWQDRVSSGESLGHIRLVEGSWRHITLVEGTWRLIRLVEGGILKAQQAGGGNLKAHHTGGGNLRAPEGTKAQWRPVGTLVWWRRSEGTAGWWRRS